MVRESKSEMLSAAVLNVYLLVLNKEVDIGSDVSSFFPYPG